MSSIGGSMFPRFLMPEARQKAGLLTINAWAIDGFTKIFWRDEPLSHLWPQVLVLVGIAIVLFAIARWQLLFNDTQGRTLVYNFRGFSKSKKEIPADGRK
jgi:hypothetical protein